MIIIAIIIAQFSNIFYTNGKEKLVVVCGVGLGLSAAKYAAYSSSDRPC